MIKKLSITTNMNTMKGLTLIELMITLAVIAVLVAVGLPRLQGMSAGNRMSSAINTLAGDLALARSEAINRNRNVAVNQVAGGWANGWTTDAIGVAGLPAIQLSSRGPIPNGMTLTELNGIANVPYGSDGMNASGLARIFTLCDSGKQPRIINVNISGRYTTSIDGLAPACP